MSSNLLLIVGSAFSFVPRSGTRRWARLGRPGMPIAASLCIPCRTTEGAIPLAALPNSLGFAHFVRRGCFRRTRQIRRRARYVQTFFQQAATHRRAANASAGRRRPSKSALGRPRFRAAGCHGPKGRGRSPVSNSVPHERTSRHLPRRGRPHSSPKRRRGRRRRDLLLLPEEGPNAPGGVGSVFRSYRMCVPRPPHRFRFVSRGVSLPRSLFLRRSRPRTLRRGYGRREQRSLRGRTRVIGGRHSMQPRRAPLGTARPPASRAPARARRQALPPPSLLR